MSPRSSAASAIVDPAPAVVVVTGPAAGGRYDGNGTSRTPPPGAVHTGEVGDVRPGTEAGRRLLARYLVARTVGDRAVTGLLGLGLVFAVVTAALAAAGWGFLAFLAGVVSVAWFVAWRLARAVWGRLSGGRVLEPVRGELDAVVAGVRPAVRRELRRLGLPTHPLAGPVIGWRMLGRRRGETLARIRGFDVDRVVAPADVDRLHLILHRVQVPHRGPAARSAR